MKYKVTEKHPIYKSGVVISPSTEEVIDGKEGLTIASYELQLDGKFYDHVLELCITEMLENEWIKEIQEPKFTKDEMIHFKIYDSELFFNETERLLNEWIKKHKV